MSGLYSIIEKQGFVPEENRLQVEISCDEIAGYMPNCKLHFPILDALSYAKPIAVYVKGKATGRVGLSGLDSLISRNKTRYLIGFCPLFFKG